MAAITVFLATQLPSNGWYEGMVVLPDSTLLVARVDKPELYHVDPGAGDDAEPRLLYTFQEPGIQSIINICPVPGRPDEFALLLGNVDMLEVGASDFQIWRLQLSLAGDEPPQATRVADLLDAGLALGMVAIADHLVLVTDSQRCCIHCIDTATGSTSIFLEDDAFTKESDEHPMALTRLCVTAGARRGHSFLWFANSSKLVLGRVPVAIDGGVDGRSARVAGPIEIMGGLMPSSDGLAVAADGSVAFTTTVNDGQLWKLDLEKGTPISVLKGGLVNPSAVGLDAQGAVVFALCNGEIEIGWTVDPERPWREIQDINNHVQVSVSVTEEWEG